VSFRLLHSRYMNYCRVYLFLALENQDGSFLETSVIKLTILLYFGSRFRMVCPPQRVVISFIMCILYFSDIARQYLILAESDASGQSAEQVR
jgi:hypothetical protein